MFIMWSVLEVTQRVPPTCTRVHVRVHVGLAVDVFAQRHLHQTNGLCFVAHGGKGQATIKIRRRVVRQQQGGVGQNAFRSTCVGDVAVPQQDLKINSNPEFEGYH